MKRGGMRNSIKNRNQSLLKGLDNLQIQEHICQKGQSIIVLLLIPIPRMKGNQEGQKRNKETIDQEISCTTNLTESDTDIKNLQHHYSRNELKLLIQNYIGEPT